MLCDNTPEWLWKPHSLTLSFIFSLASEIVRDWRPDVDVSAGSEDDPEEPHLHRLFCIIFKIHHLKLNYSFLSDFIKFIWTLHWHVKKVCTQVCAMGLNCSHRQKIMSQNVICHREKDWHFCTKNFPGHSCRIESHFPASSLTYGTGIQQCAEMTSAPVRSLSGHYLGEEQVLLWRCLTC